MPLDKGNNSHQTEPLYHGCLIHFSYLARHERLNLFCQIFLALLFINLPLLMMPLPIEEAIGATGTTIRMFFHFFTSLFHARTNIVMFNNIMSLPSGKEQIVG
jgi:hypothetical protein